MKILQLCNKIPYPPHDGGSIAMLNLARGLADAGQEVVVLAMSTGKHSFDPANIPSGLQQKVLFRYVPVNTEITTAGLISNLFFSDMPYNAQRFLSKDFAEELLKTLQDSTFDIIQLEGLYLCHYIDLIRRHSDARIVLRAHNVESMIWERLRKNTRNPARKIYLSILCRRLRKFEHSCLNRCDLLLPISQFDERQLRSMGCNLPSQVLATGLDPEHFISEEIPKEQKKLFFIGALDWIPNQEGLIWLSDKVWPLIKKALPEAEFHVAGRNAPDKLIDKLRSPGIIYHGEVEDAAYFMTSHHIMLAPLFSGSGIRIKIIEAMARSRVVVTTPIGAEGLGTEDGREAYIRQSEKDFAAAVVELCSNDDTFTTMRRTAFRYAREHFDNTKLTGELIRFYKEYTA